MKNYINIKNRREAINAMNELKEKKNDSLLIRLDNVNLRKINYHLKHKIFKNNDLYVDANTLYEIMQPVGKQGRHHYHGLTPEMIIESLNKIEFPYCVFEDGIQKYAVITSEQNDNGDFIMIVIAIEMNQFIDKIDEINKFVTMFPKKDIDSFLKNMPQEKILYKSVFK